MYRSRMESVVDGAGFCTVQENTGFTSSGCILTPGAYQSCERLFKDFYNIPH
jgi:hypothetical protein